MKIVNKITKILFATSLVLVSCKEDPFDVEPTFSDVAWWSSFEEQIGAGTDLLVDIGDYAPFIDASVGAISHEWIIEEGNEFLKGPIKSGKNIRKFDFTPFIIEKGNTRTTDKAVNVYFTKGGVGKKVILRNVFKDSVAFRHSFQGSTLKDKNGVNLDSVVAASKVGDNWVFEQSISINVYDSIIQSINLTEEDGSVIDTETVELNGGKIDVSDFELRDVPYGTKLNFTDLTNTIGYAQATSSRWFVTRAGSFSFNDDDKLKENEDVLLDVTNNYDPSTLSSTSTVTFDDAPGTVNFVILQTKRNEITDKISADSQNAVSKIAFRTVVSTDEAILESSKVDKNKLQLVFDRPVKTGINIEDFVLDIKDRDGNTINAEIEKIEPLKTDSSILQVTLKKDASDNDILLYSDDVVTITNESGNLTTGDGITVTSFTNLQNEVVVEKFENIFGVIGDFEEDLKVDWAYRNGNPIGDIEILSPPSFDNEVVTDVRPEGKVARFTTNKNDPTAAKAGNRHLTTVKGLDFIEQGDVYTFKFKMYVTASSTIDITKQAGQVIFRFFNASNSKIEDVKIDLGKADPLKLNRWIEHEFKLSASTKAYEGMKLVILPGWANWADFYIDNIQISKSTGRP